MRFGESSDRVALPTARSQSRSHAHPAMNETFSTHDEYIAMARPDVQPILAEIRSLVQSRVPDAVETISYRMPAFKLRRVFFFYAAFKNHIGIYPPVGSDAALIAELEPYRGPKGNLSFPLDRPIPYELIGRVALALAAEVG